ALFVLTFAEIVVGGAQPTLRRAIWVKLGLGHHGDAAVLAHLEQFEAARRASEHPVLAFELCGHAVDRTLDAERLAATDAAERLFLIEHARRCGGGAEIELRRERDHLLGTGCLAQPALHAGIFGKSQGRTFRIVTECAGRAGRYASEAERAALDVELDAT